MGVNLTPKLELRWRSYYNSKLELNLTPLELNFNSFVELNSSLTMQGELNELLSWSHFWGVSITPLVE